MLTSLTLADTKPPEHDVKILWWIRIDGCPTGKYQLFIAAEVDGKDVVKHFDETDAPPEDTLKQILNNVGGFRHKFECGISA